MKPKHLKCPFTWDSRAPTLFRGVLFVPQYYDKHQEWVFPGWEDPSLFGNAHPVFIEYCAGNGAWVVEKALAHPDRNWVAVEKNFERVRKIWSKVQNNCLKNLLVVGGEALTFTRYYLPADSVDGVYVNFPDPWPKPKHAKHRLIQGEFIREIARVVKPAGKAIYVTDDPPYSAHMIAEMQQSELWRSVYPEPCFVTQWPGYGSSFFDQLWREKGRTIHYMQFENR